MYNKRIFVVLQVNSHETLQVADLREKKNVQFVILYTDGVEETGKYRVFHVKDTASKVTEERMRNTWYPMDTVGGEDGDAKRNYFFYRFDEEVNIGQIDIRKLLADLKVLHLKEFNRYIPGEPMFTTAEVLKEYRSNGSVFSQYNS